MSIKCKVYEGILKKIYYLYIQWVHSLMSKLGNKTNKLIINKSICVSKYPQSTKI